MLMPEPPPTPLPWMTLRSTSAFEITPSPPCAHVAVHVDAVGVVVVRVVAADHRPVAAVGDVDAVLELRVVGLVALDREVVGEAGEDAPAAVVAGAAVADGDERPEHGADAGAGAVVDHEPVDDDVAGALEVDAVGGRAVVGRDLHRRALGQKRDRRSRRPGTIEVEALVVAVLDVHRVAGIDLIGGVTERRPSGRERQTVEPVVTAVLDVVVGGVEPKGRGA